MIALDMRASGRDSGGIAPGSEVTVLDTLMIDLSGVGIVVTELDNVEIDIPNVQGEMRVVGVGDTDQGAGKVGLDTVSADTPDDQKERGDLDPLFAYGPGDHHRYLVMREGEVEGWWGPGQEDFDYSHGAHQNRRIHHRELELELVPAGKDYYLVMIPSIDLILMEQRGVHARI